MIAFLARTKRGSILHLLRGKQSRLWEDFHGASVLDMTELLGQTEPGKPVVLKLTECSDESETAARLRSAIGDGQDYPFMANVQMVAPMQPPPTSGGSGTPKPARGKCSMCEDPNSELVPGLDGVCYACARISVGLQQQADGDEQ